jgi:hypothetical protein
MTPMKTVRWRRTDMTLTHAAPDLLRLWEELREALRRNLDNCAFASESDRAPYEAAIAAWDKLTKETP